MSAAVMQCQPLSYDVSHCHTMSAAVIRCQPLSCDVSRCHAMSATVIRCQPLSYDVSHCHTMSAAVIRCRYLSAAGAAIVWRVAVMISTPMNQTDRPSGCRPSLWSVRLPNSTSPFCSVCFHLSALLVFLSISFFFITVYGNRSKSGRE